MTFIKILQLLERINAAGPLDFDNLSDQLLTWIDEAKVGATIQLDQRLSDLGLPPSQPSTFPADLEKVYSQGSPYFHRNDQEALAIAHSEIFVRLTKLSKQSPGYNKTNQIVAGIPCFRIAADAAFQCQRFNICLQVCEQAISLLQSADLEDWISHREAHRDRLNNHFYSLHGFAALAAYELESPQLALKHIGRKERHSELQSPDTLAKDDILKGKILERLFRSREAVNTYKAAIERDGLSKKIQLEINSTINQTMYRITGNYRYLLSANNQTLDENELAQSIDITASLIEGTVSSEQLTKDIELLDTSFSDERIESLVLKTGVASDGIILRKSKETILVDLANLAIQQKQYIKIRHLLPQIEKISRGRGPNRVSATGFLLNLTQTNTLSDILGIDWSPDNSTSLKTYLTMVADLEETEHQLAQSVHMMPIIMTTSHSTLHLAQPQLKVFFQQLVDKSRSQQTNITVHQQIYTTALHKRYTERYLILLTFLASIFDEESSFWLKSIATLKRLWDFAGLNTQRAWQLYAFAQQLPLHVQKEITDLSEKLTLIPGKGSVTLEKLLEYEEHLQSLLLPLKQNAGDSTHYKNSETDKELVFLDDRTINGTDRPVDIFAIYKHQNQWYRQQETIVPQRLNQFVEDIRESASLSRLNKEQVSSKIAIIKKQGQNLTQAILPPPFTQEVEYLPIRSTGILQDLPLESLPLRENPEEGMPSWLGEITTTVLLTADSNDIKAVTTSMTVANVVIFAYPLPTPGFGKIANTAEEANAIEQVFNSTETGCKPYIQEYANRNRFLQFSGSNAPQILHVATHGLENAKRNTLCWLALSNRDENNQYQRPAVGFYDISLMDLRQTDLVVLSACSTHSGKQTQGESALSLAWAFKAAGAKAVIGTRWPVHDIASVMFWQVFYQQLAAGSSIVKALQQARITLIRSSRWCHPCYWAAFQLIV